MKQSNGLPMIKGNVKGFEEATSDDIVIPRVKLVQKMSNEIDDYEDMKPGMLINSISKDNIGGKKNELEFIPLDFNKTRIKWFPFDEGGGIDCKSDNNLMGTKYGECARCKHIDFGKEGQPPECTLIYNYPSIIIGYQEEFPIYISMFKTSMGVGKQLNAIVKLAQASGIAECYANRFILGTQQQEKEGQKYYVYTIRTSDKQVNKTMLKNLEILYNMVKLAKEQGKIKVEDIENESSEEDLEDKEY